jgi:hypothetical protein
MKAKYKTTEITAYPSGYKAEREFNKIFTDANYQKGLELIKERIGEIEEDLIKEDYNSIKSRSTKRLYPHYDRPLAGYFYLALSTYRDSFNKLIIMQSPETLEWDSFDRDEVIYKNPEGETKALEILNLMLA